MTNVFCHSICLTLAYLAHFIHAFLTHYIHLPIFLLTEFSKSLYLSHFSISATLSVSFYLYVHVPAFIFTDWIFWRTVDASAVLLTWWKRQLSFFSVAHQRGEALEFISRGAYHYKERRWRARKFYEEVRVVLGVKRRGSWRVLALACSVPALHDILMTSNFLYAFSLAHSPSVNTVVAQEL